MTGFGVQGTGCRVKGFGIGVRLPFLIFFVKPFEYLFVTNHTVGARAPSPLHNLATPFIVGGIKFFGDVSQRARV
jgi:hypothetical protein